MFKFLKEKIKSVITTFTKKEEAIVEPPAETTPVEDITIEQPVLEVPTPRREQQEQQQRKQTKEQPSTKEKKEQQKTQDPKQQEPAREVKKKQHSQKTYPNQTRQPLQQPAPDSPPTTTHFQPPTIPLEPAKPQGFFKKLTSIITTTTITQERFDEFSQHLELALLENNVAYDVVQQILSDLSTALVGKKFSRGEVENTITTTLRESIIHILTLPTPNLLQLSEKEHPLIICFVGVNGSGKTTTIAKLTKLFLDNEKTVVLAAGDTFRAAAIDQLQEHADKLGVKLIKHSAGADPAAVAFDAVQHALQKEKDVVLIDTAGRLHTNANLIDELKKIKRVVKPHLTIFVGESITGNDCVEQATTFNNTVGIDGIILTKADVDEKGGAPLSITKATHKPILYIGAGQEYSDLREFNVDEIVGNLL